jgi:ABC-type branched-subunit amino acid transport system substrate-binding protein
VAVTALLVAAAIGTAAPVQTTPNADSHPGVGAKTIKIGLVVALTGPASSSFGKDSVDAVKGVFNVVNARGGINGRRLQLVVADDASSPTQNPTAVKSLISQGVFGIVESTPLFFAGYRDAVKAGIPVTGVGIDGPEWGDPKNYNLFNPWGSFATTYPTFTTEGKYLKRFGVTKLAVVAAGNSPSATGTAKANANSAKLFGIEVPVFDTSQPLGSTNYNATALTIKNSGADGLLTEVVTNSNVAIVTALRQQGVDIKGSFISGGYQQALLDDPATAQAMDGIMFPSQFRPWVLPGPGVTAFKAAMATVGYHKPNPQQGQTFGYFAADLMAEGLKRAGKNPTWGSFITNLRAVKDYDAHGGIGGKVDFSKFSNVDPNSGANCIFPLELKSGKFVSLTAKPICGQLAPK